MDIHKTLQFKVVKEKEIEDKKVPFEFSFIMPENAPIGMSYDALYEMMGKVVESAQVAFERMKQKEKEEESDVKDEE